MSGHKEEDPDQLTHLLLSRMDSMAAQIKALALAQPVVRPTATPPQKEEVQKPKVNQPVVQLFVCKCCRNKGHDTSTCQSLAPDFAPEEELFIEEVDYVQGSFNGGNQGYSQRQGNQVEIKTTKEIKVTIKGKLFMVTTKEVKGIKVRIKVTTKGTIKGKEAKAN